MQARMNCVRHGERSLDRAALYELSGDTLTVRPTVAKDPDMMNPGVGLVYSVKFGEDALELTFIRVDGVPRGANARPYTIKMRRLE